MKNIVVLISGRGSNFLSIAEKSQKEDWEHKYGAKIALVVSNRPEAKGLEYARQFGIATAVVDHKLFSDRKTFESRLVEVIAPYEPAVIVLAGFMRVLTEHFINAFPGKILNIHPALLPAFKGLNTHERAILEGVRVHGTTVHFVTPELDSGSIIGQAVVPVLPDDDPETLAHRVLGYEHQLFPLCIKAVLSGSVSLVEGKTKMDNQTALSLTLLAESVNV